jgi:hypothetical protein
MIREHVTCDICGIDKKEANHWFTAYEEKGTLKLNAGVLKRKHPATKHLCGQGCVHRFIDDFLAGHCLNDGVPVPETSAEVGENSPTGQADSEEIEFPPPLKN